MTNSARRLTYEVTRRDERLRTTWVDWLIDGFLLASAVVTAVGIAWLARWGWGG